MIRTIEFGGMGFNSLFMPMVVALPITMFALAFAREWFFCRNRSDDSNNNDDNQEEIDMNNVNSLNKKGGNASKALRIAIGTILGVGYHTTINMGAGALLTASKASTR